ncbi:Glycosyltransferase family 29 (sialyltransferase) [Paracoccus haematequi]|uniref:Glycosyltransferase family 29 (Sialyltransferase) n=1 Tax=Paracoccus haematequi TaxID=2491866 RepID=A0A3S4ERD1_9RHOB|nr:glycosyltransferase family 29 protein [Paracoccus haematequi]VDS08313.1 Glycosyltransferase family 29 (sialyltransferase) [Paracoccus haematequi]
MNKLRFYAARTLRDDAALQALSVPQSDLLAELAGKTVALIGNARSLAETRHGAAIDATDLVIRINRAPMPSPESHGTRTDWLALAVRLADADLARIAPRRVLWMSPKRKRLGWRIAHGDGFYLHPLADYLALKDRLAAPPTTGAMMIDLALRSGLARLTLHGFDFFASQSLSGSRTADQVPHDFGAEAAWVADMQRRDGRLILA